MRILFLTHYTGLYGANRSLLTLVRGLGKRGVDCAVLVPRRGRVCEVFSDEGVEWGVVPFRPWMGEARWRAPYRAAMNLSCLPSLLRRIDGWGADVLYSNSSVIPSGAYASALRGLPHVWHIREFGWSDYRLKHDLGRWWFRFWLGRADAAIAVSHAVKKSVVDPTAAPCSVVYNAVATSERIAALEETDRRRTVGSPFTFGIVGVLRPEKGQAQAIDAVARLRDRERECRLVIVGGGSPDYEQRLRVLVERRNLGDRVRFTGFVEDPFDVYTEFDAVLMCSEQEAMGRVTAEAMASARPVIGRRTGGTVEVIAEGQTGLLYDGTTRDLVCQMARLIDDLSLARRLGREGRQVARDVFVEDAYVSAVEAVVEGVV